MLAQAVVDEQSETIKVYDRIFGQRHPRAKALRELYANM